MQKHLKGREKFIPKLIQMNKSVTVKCQNTSVHKKNIKRARKKNLTLNNRYRWSMASAQEIGIEGILPLKFRSAKIQISQHYFIHYYNLTPIGLALEKNAMNFNTL